MSNGQWSMDNEKMILRIIGIGFIVLAAIVVVIFAVSVCGADQWDDDFHLMAADYAAPFALNTVLGIGFNMSNWTVPDSLIIRVVDGQITKRPVNNDDIDAMNRSIKTRLFVADGVTMLGVFIHEADNSNMCFDFDWLDFLKAGGMCAVSHVMLWRVMRKHHVDPEPEPITLWLDHNYVGLTVRF